MNLSFYRLDTSKRSPSQYFAPIVEALVSWGYRRGINVVGAPYDWRRAPSKKF
jgi:lysophospholipase-3